MPINRYFLSDFVSVQRESFFQLLEKGLIEEFSKRNPIIHRREDCSYYFYPEYYILTRPEYKPSEAIVKNKSYTSKLYVPVQITNKKEKRITLKWVYIGNIPLMTKRGHFILNGATRVIVNQILRSPGAYYQQKIYENYEKDNISKNKDDREAPARFARGEAENLENQNDSNVFLQTEDTYKRFYCDLICMRGSWLRIEMDKEKSIWVQMKRGPKIPIFWFLLAMGLSEKFILKSITDSEKLLGNLERNSVSTRNMKFRPRVSSKHGGSGNNDKSKTPERNSLETKKKYLSSKKTHDAIENRVAPTILDSGVFPRVSSKRGDTSYANEDFLSKTELHNEAGGAGGSAGGGAPQSLRTPRFEETQEAEQTLKKRNYPYLKNPPEAWESIYTLLHSKTKTFTGKSPRFEETREGVSAAQGTGGRVLTDLRSPHDTPRAGASRYNLISRVLPRTTTKSLTELGRQWLYNRFMNPRSYDLGKQGRIALNQKLGLNISLQQLTLTGLDLLYATDYLIKLDKGFYKVDDIDHLKNRRVRTSGELIQIQIGVGLVRLEKFLRYSEMNFESAKGAAIFDRKPARGAPAIYDRGKKKSLKEADIGFGEVGAKPGKTSPDYSTKQKTSSSSKTVKPDFRLEKIPRDRKIASELDGPEISRFSSKHGGSGDISDLRNADVTRDIPFTPRFEETRGIMRASSLLATQRFPSILQSRGQDPLHGPHGPRALRARGYRHPVIADHGGPQSPSGLRALGSSAFGGIRGRFKSTLTSSRINSKAFNSAIREFFGTSPLSQFMDQINPLAELTHKRRLSSMGPGGVTRDTATLAIRGIHPTHYGRICPIETPEGKNTGLVNSMTTYARVNYAGLLESPFYKVYKGQVQKNTGMYYLTAEQEEKIKLSAADLFVSRIGFLPKSMIPVRIAETFTKIDRKSVQFIGVSPLQMISIAASLIPFLEHDDANRALMGSNMQRQAVPLIRPQRPIVGTGLEGKAVSDSGHVVQAKNSGLVTYVSSKKIIVSEPRPRVSKKHGGSAHSTREL
jgi:DNA-directed RNA polymerase beta subunit